MIRKELLDKLELIKPAIADKDIVPIFMNYVFNNDIVYGYNDNLGIIAPCKINDSFAIHGQTIFGFLKNSRAKDINFTKHSDEIEIKAAKSKITLPYYDEEEYLFAEPENEWDIEIDINDDLLEGIKLCLMTSSQDYSLPALMGVTFKVDKNVHLYSCEGDAISRYFIKKVKNNDEERTYTLPNAFCTSLIKVKTKTKAKKGKLSLNEEWAKAEFTNGYKVYGRLIENEDPLDHEKQIQQTLKDKPTYVPTPKGFVHALSRARVLADPESQPTVLQLKDNKIRLTTDTPMGNIRDIVRLKEKHPEVRAVINASMVQRSIEICDELAILDNCTCYRNGKKFFQIVANME